MVQHTQIIRRQIAVIFNMTTDTFKFSIFQYFRHKDLLSIDLHISAFREIMSLNK